MFILVQNTHICTSERFELVLKIKLLSPRSREVNAQIRADGILLQCPAHLGDPLHHCICGWTFETKKDIQK